ncbi:hypothetical protein BCT61_12520 [Vibrio breoganii]|uniref:LPP20 family lipoprotein n=1 Tax=Vibrio breoganii TaxID=553239 RepID=UPI000C85EAD9|nr:LPP20 family lipoprotein [Vibrio breoganii]PMG03664.1 hypothetical protein BCV00_16055 [Vibrio breoganii]PMK27789.1 hypothetical protein BCU03_15535 [Vibrio breoganii]PMM08597.1 hypothetical protein BCT61_12520 [Vibrio breoganii]
MKKIIFTAICLAIAGCQSAETVESAQNYATCTFPDAPSAEAPSWVCDVMPEDLAIAATGYAKKSASGMSIMRKVAVNDARVNLASEFQTDVSSMFKQAIESSVKTTEANAEENVVEVVESVTKNVVSKSLTNSRIVVSQVSPSGGLYVLIGMDDLAYKANVEKVVDTVGEDSKLWNQFNNEKTAEDLSNALQSLKAL